MRLSDQKSPSDTSGRSALSKKSAIMPQGSFFTKMRAVVFFIFLIVLLSALLLFFVLLYKNDSFEASVDALFIKGTELAGLRLDSVVIIGADKTKTDDIVARLDLKKGRSVFSYSPQNMQEKLEIMPWIEDAVVERRLPDTLYISLKERQAIGLWQKDGRFFLFDAAGVIIAVDNALTYAGTGKAALKIFIGEGAREAAFDLLRALKEQPDILQHVVSAGFLSKRRWRLHLDNEIIIQLPEKNIETALGRLGSYEKEQKILSRDISGIDLRYEDKIILRKRSKK